jgi:23S rRNA (uridine2552-2'-O)-methyltransferase
MTKPKGFVKRGNERYDRHDPYFRKAKKEGFVARSIYKLEEIDAAFSLLAPSSIVLDLGCAPGSWLQYVASRLDPARGGRAVGVDLLPVRTSFPAHVRTLVADVNDLSPESLLPDGPPPKDPARPFDVVLSDMAPSTTGVRSVDQARSAQLCDMALSLADRLAARGSHLCFKVLEGGDTKAFLDELRARYTTVKVRRPKSTRPGSTETYLVALTRKATP